MVTTEPKAGAAELTEKDTESKNVDSLNGVLDVMHIGSLITAEDDSDFTFNRLEKRAQKIRILGFKCVR